MNFIFSAPFRTNINLNSLTAVDSSELISKILVKSINVANQNISTGFIWKTAWKTADVSELHYSDLLDDKLSLSATPLLRLLIAGDEILPGLIRPVNGNQDQAVEVTRCFIDYYDNTIGILSVELSFSCIENKAELFSSIDKWSTHCCSSIIKFIKPIEENIRLELGRNSGAMSPGMFINPGKFNVFFDRNIIHHNKTDLAEREEMLWVTRIFLTDLNDQDSELLQNWTQQPNLLEKKVKLGQACAVFCAGNSIVYGHLSNKENLALKTSLSISTYFYVLYVILNQNLRLTFVSISKEKKASNLVITNVNRIRGHIEFIENEFCDVLMGLQGLRNDITRMLLKTWNYAELVSAVQQKKNSVGKVVDFTLQEKQSRYGRIIESILAAIGGVAVLDFSLTLFTFSSNEKLIDDSILGLVDAAKYLSVDGTLYTIIVFLIFMLFLVMKKR